MTELLKFVGKSGLKNPTMVVGWDDDAGQLGTKITEYLTNTLGGHKFCEIDPVKFSPLNGVAIENDVVQFPESLFFACPEQDLLVLQSTIPRYDWFKFLNLIIDVARDHCNVREIYAVGGMIAITPHTAPRDMWATFGSTQIKKSLSSYELSREMDYETPPGGRPTLNAFLLWIAKTRQLAGANLWVPVPFYLVDFDDLRGHKRILEFLDDRLDLELDFSEIDNNIKKQDRKLNRLRRDVPEIEQYLTKLENGQPLSEEEHENMIKVVGEYLKRRDF
jgi:proteasome assembly chaperone (PAC2) family protein